MCGVEIALAEGVRYRTVVKAQARTVSCKGSMRSIERVNRMNRRICDRIESNAVGCVG